MKEVKQKKNSGQILLIAAFIMASLLLSAQLYVLEVGEFSGDNESEFVKDFLLSVELGSRHAVVGSLANVSNGGAISILELNLREWQIFVDSQFLYGKSVLSYTVVETASHSSGMRLFWGNNGYGISSACANFTHEFSGRDTDIEQSFFLNITTSSVITSTNRRLSGTTRQVNVTISVLNEGETALARQITVYYRVYNDWLIPDESNNFTLQNYGNGTYLASFTADFPTSEVEVSSHIIDCRDIFVQANVTSIEI